MHERLLRTGLRASIRQPLRSRPTSHFHPHIFPPQCRPQTTSRPYSSPSSDPNSPRSAAIFSPNQPPSLPDRLSQLHKWTLTPSKKGISRAYKFSGFAPAWRFMNIVADECKVKRHHPSWHNLYNEVTIEWTTHKPEGLSIKDVEMAEFCDRVAGEIGERGAER